MVNQVPSNAPQKFTYEQVARKMIQQLNNVNYDNSLQDVLSKTDFTTIITTLNTGIALEVDAFILSGELTPEAGFQYGILDQTIAKIHATIDLLAAKIAQKFVEKFSNNQKTNLTKPDFKNILIFYYKISKLLTNITNNCKTPFRTDLANQIAHKILNKIVFESQLHVHNNTPLGLIDNIPLYLKPLTEAIEKLNYFELESNKAVHLGTQQILQAFACKQIIEKPQNLDKLIKLLQPTDGNAVKQLPEIKQDDLQILFKKLIALKEYRRISIVETPTNIKDLQLHIYNDIVPGLGMHENGSTGLICCYIGIQFNNDTLPTPNLIKGKNYSYIKLEANITNYLALGLNTTTGEIVFLTNSSLSIKQFINTSSQPNLYEHLKLVLYNIIHSYLANKEPDIDDLLKNPDPITNLKNQTQQSAEAAIQGTTPPSEKACQPEPETQEPSTSAPQLPPPNGTENNKANKSNLYQKLKNLDGNDIKRILNSLLGDPIRINGSHHVYYSNKTNATYPIPFHGNDRIGFGLLKKCLEVWGITEEFMAEL